jgi:hypothetical protein
MLQQVNKAAAGDLKATNALFSWITGLGNVEQTGVANPLARESDALVMASIIRRIRESENPRPETEPDQAAPDGLAKLEPA